MIKKMFAAFFAALLLITCLPVSASANTYSDLKSGIISETAVLVDAETGQVLFEKNMHKLRYPASITKIMTALLALENGDLNDVITMTHDAVFSVGRDTSHIALDVNEQLTLEQALHALAVASANDAANGIAELIGGSIDGFVEMMNERAKAAGALNTSFVNANGLPDEAHLTTAYDMARITMAALKAPEFTEIFSQAYYEMSPTNKQPETRLLRRTNAMVNGSYRYNGIIAYKTGWTKDAQHTLVTVAERGDRTLIAVVMKSSDTQDKWEDTTALLNFGFDNFKKVSFSAGELAQNGFPFADENGNPTDVELSLPEGCAFLLENSLTKDDIDVQYAAESLAGEPYSAVKVFFSVKPSAGGLMYPDLGESVIQAVFPAAQDPASESGDDPGGDSQPRTASVLTWLLCFLAFAVAALVILLIIRYRNIRKWRLRKQRAIEQYTRQNKP